MKPRTVIENKNLTGNEKAANSLAAEQTDVGIKKTTETYYFELEGGAAKKHDFDEPHKAQKPKVPEKPLTGLRKVKEKPKQELEGSPASELSGDTLRTWTRDSMMKKPLGGS